MSRKFFTPIDLQGNQLLSSVTTGTAPMVITSETVVENLNAEMVGGYIPGGIVTLNAPVTADLGTTTDLPTNTYSNGVSGVGATLTATSNGLLTLDGCGVSLGQNVLIKDEATTPAHNGLYVVTQAGDSSHPFILTRHPNMDQPNEFFGWMIFLGVLGTINLNTTWTLSSTFQTTINVGTDPVSFTKIALYPGYNLSDLPNITVARTNLGLGSAATLTAGVANGAATLDSGGKVPTSQLPSSILGGVNYQGAWNATTNSPTLTSSTGTKGFYYKVTTAGTTTLDGISSWIIGDWVIFNGSTWDKVDGNANEVQSVAGRTGAVSLAVADVSGAAPLVSPTFTGTVGLPTATLSGTLNKITITQPATSATLTIANGKTFTASNSLTMAGTDGSTLSLAGNLTTSGAFGVTFTATGTTTITLPTSGTLLTTAGGTMAGNLDLNGHTLTSTSGVLNFASSILEMGSGSITFTGNDRLDTGGLLHVNLAQYAIDSSGNFITTTGVTVCDSIGLQANRLTAGTVPTARLGSGTANSSAFLRGDQTWQSIVVASVTSGGGLSLSAGTLSFSGASYSPVAGSSSITTLGTIGTGIWQGTAVGVVYGGTGLTAATLGDVIYGSAANTLARLSGNTTSTKQFLAQTGTGSVSAAPVWAAIILADLPLTSLDARYQFSIIEDIGFAIDGGGLTLIPGNKGYKVVDFACTIVGWTLLADQSGTANFDIKKSTYAGFPTTASITGSAQPALSSAQSNQNTSSSLSTWTTQINAGDILEFDILNPTPTSITRVSLTLTVQRSIFPTTEDIAFTFDGGGSALVASSKNYKVIDFPCTILGWTVLADQSGSVTFDVKKAAYAGFPTMTSITASAQPALSSARNAQSSTLTGWTTQVNAGDVLEFDVTGTPASVTRATLSLKVQRFQAASVEDVGVIINGAGNVILAGTKGYKEIDFPCTIVGWTLLADQSGSITLDIKKCQFSGFPTTTSITASAKPALSSVQNNQAAAANLTGWTTQINAGDILEFDVTGTPTSVKQVSLILKVQRT